MSVNLTENILPALVSAVENITPDVRPDVTFERWRGAGPVERAPADKRLRRFQFRLGTSRTPRTLSSRTLTWMRADLLLVVGYAFQTPQPDDSEGLGLHWIVFADQKQILQALQFQDALFGVSHVLRLVFLEADPPTDKARVYRFDLEWAE